MTLSEESPALDDSPIALARERRRVPLCLAIVACSVPIFMVGLATPSSSPSAGQPLPPTSHGPDMKITIYGWSASTPAAL
ncbi:hypothetical protein EDD90_10803 [Streptomyces sp. Ag109_O5-1]|uniref:hypothetical protein n=1 Tax=Streptomyces sp. Ag109_O5-1 TaxID=1938851 RepID=UPI000F502772|nr:hypothetical protein [Streptomyces sp. Ag109_O5-1]RPE27118.1 hypothetical protein EDD90_10803 [Streptomyces sp. Ag109_O5-1]